MYDASSNAAARGFGGRVRGLAQAGLHVITAGGLESCSTTDRLLAGNTSMGYRANSSLLQRKSALQ